MIASIKIYIKSTFHVIRYKNEMKFHMLIFMNAWMMLVLMNADAKMQSLTQECYIPHLDSLFICIGFAKVKN